MKPLFLGYTEDRERLVLTARDLDTHVHGVGATRSGKSKLIEWIARELVRNRQGFLLIDPHGFLYQDLLRWLAWVRPRREILLFDPSSEARIVGFNPFRRRGGEDISAQVDRRVRATVKAWGAAGTDETPRLERWLRCLYHALLELGLPLATARYFFAWAPRPVRQELVRRLAPGSIRDEWEELLSYTRPELFSAQVESARNRLFRFTDPRQLQRIMGLPTNVLDLESIIEGGKVLLVNLQPSAVLTEENGRLLGTLLLNELWEVGARRKQTRRGRPPSDFFVLIDEFQQFLTPDIPAMLTGAAKYGFHLFLFHQHLSQLRTLDEAAYGAVNNARVKLVFGGLSREDARIMAENIFPGQIDLKRVKHLVEQTKFWPVYTRDTVYSSGSSSGSGRAEVNGMTWNPVTEEWVPTGSISVSDFGAVHEGMADIPFLYPVPFREESHTEFYSLEDSLWQLTDRLMEQYQRHFMIRRPGHKTVAAVTPYVQTWFVRPDRVAAYADQTRRGFLTAAEVDRALAAAQQQLEDASRTSEAGAPPAASGPRRDPVTHGRKPRTPKTPAADKVP